MPLILKRKPGESLTITGPATVEILASTRLNVTIRITADTAVKIVRGELVREVPAPQPEAKRE